MKLVVASVQESIDRGRVAGVGPRASRNRLQTTTLLDAIEEHRFDAALGGARRDEEKARAKERVFSFRDEFGQWDPQEPASRVVEPLQRPPPAGRAHPTVRYRTVGDATITGAVESAAATVEQVIDEIAATRLTERGAARADDRVTEAAMEDRKKEGYF